MFLGSLAQVSRSWPDSGQIFRLFPGYTSLGSRPGPQPSVHAGYMYSIYTYLVRVVFDNIYEYKIKDMLVRIDTKNWLGNYNSHVVRLNSQKHLDNYLRVCYSNEITSKVIGHEILQD